MSVVDPVGSPLLHAWIPALEVAERRLRRGASVAEIGVATRSSAIELAFAYPASTFHGFDPDPDAVAAIREAIARAGVSDRVTYEVQRPRSLVRSGYDIVRGPMTWTRGHPVRSALRTGGVLIDTSVDGVRVRPRATLVRGW